MSCIRRAVFRDRRDGPVCASVLRGTVVSSPLPPRYIRSPLMNTVSRLAAAIGSLAMVHCSSRGEEGASAGGSDASLDSITGLDAGSPSDANPGIDLAHDAGSRPSDASADGYADAALCPSVAQACGDAANADVGCATTWAT